VRGFQSCVDINLLAGLGASTVIDSLRIVWPDDKTQLLPAIKADQTIELRMTDAREVYNYHPLSTAAYFTASAGGPLYEHRDNAENDFNRQYLLPQCYSYAGPCMAKADINGDGLEDLFVGGSRGHAAGLFLQSKDGRFHALPSRVLQADTLSNDAGAAFFDADSDGDMDLYIAGGGYASEEHTAALQDRLYLNDGSGHLTPTDLPVNRNPKSCVRPCDIDGDGDMDVFVGGGIIPGKWPAAGSSYIYINDGKGHFTDQTGVWNPLFSTIGIVTDAAWADVNGDQVKDLIVVGEWMAPTVFINRHGKLEQAHAELAGLTGWWNTILAGDFDKDGDTDFMLGNFGLNSCLQPRAGEPVELYATDIDGNGSVDPVMTSYVQGRPVPFPFMDDLNNQCPSLKKSFIDYSVYAGATIKDIIPEARLRGIKPLTAAEFRTIYLENTGAGFRVKELPREAQYAPVYAMATADVNKDGKEDLLLFGNNSHTRIRLGRQDANHGTVLLGDGKGDFRYLPPAAHGICVRGDTRSCLFINNTLLLGVNNQQVKTYQLR
jgi:hypothetical protein